MTSKAFPAAKKLLSDGLIMLGESHQDPKARQLIFELIDKGVVRSLSIELPVLPWNIQRSLAKKEENSDLDKYLDLVDKHSDAEYGNIWPLRKLIEWSIKKKVAIYCHDLPPKSNPPFRRTFSGKDYDATNSSGFSISYEQYINGIINKKIDGIGIGVKLINDESYGSNSGLKHRNRFSARFLFMLYERGLLTWEGLIILVGDHHLQASQCEKEDTLQNLLSIEDDRVFCEKDI